MFEHRKETAFCRGLSYVLLQGSPCTSWTDDMPTNLGHQWHSNATVHIYYKHTGLTIVMLGTVCLTHINNFYTCTVL